MCCTDCDGTEASVRENVFDSARFCGGSRSLKASAKNAVRDDNVEAKAQAKSKSKEIAACGKK
jgi:hypothetical protein